jgi:hypothetical protein
VLLHLTTNLYSKVKNRRWICDFFYIYGYITDGGKYGQSWSIIRRI